MNTIAFLIILSAVFYLPILLTKSIKVTKTTSSNQTSYTYSMITNDFGNSTTGKILIIIVSVLRGFISLIILAVINIFTKIEFNKFLLRKQRISSQEEVESKLLIIL